MRGWLFVALLCAPSWVAAQVVAKVEGPRGAFEITAERLSAYLADHPSKAPRDGLQDLVDFELLAAEAGAKDYPADDLRDAVDQVMVRRLLKDRFEVEVSRETIPRKYLEQGYKQNLRFFVHPELRGADHILVTKGGELPVDLAPAAKTLAAQIFADLKAAPVENAEAFRARAPAYESEAVAQGLEVRAETLGVFVREGRYDPKFTAAVFAVDQVGTVIAPFETKFGVHIVRVNYVAAAKDEKFEDAVDSLRDRVLTDARRYELRARVDEMARAAGVEVDQTPLEKLQARRQIETPEE